MKEVILNIDGLCCDHCCHRVEEALNSIEGVSKVKVDKDKEQAVVQAEDSLDNQILIDTLDEAGFDVTSIE